MKINNGEPQLTDSGKYKVDSFFYNELKRIVNLKSWHIQPELTKFFNELTPIQQRTNQQSRALHLFFTQLAEKLNLAGLEMPLILNGEVWWTPSAIKERLWRPLQKAMFGKESTTELEKQVEIDKIHEQLMHILGEKHGLEYLPFPHDPKKKEELEEDKIDYPEYQGPTAF